MGLIQKTSGSKKKRTEVFQNNVILSRNEVSYFKDYCKSEAV